MLLLNSIYHLEEVTPAIVKGNRRVIPSKHINSFLLLITRISKERHLMCSRYLGNRCQQAQIMKALQLSFLFRCKLRPKEPPAPMALVTATAVVRKLATPKK
jgi:hypothetical protein